MLTAPRVTISRLSSKKVHSLKLPATFTILIPKEKVSIIS